MQTQTQTKDTVKVGGRLVFLNALPVSALKEMRRAGLIVQYMGKLSDVQVQMVLKIAKKAPYISYISHEATANLIGVEVNKELYTAKNLDNGYIFVLATPRRQPGNVTVITEDDIDVYNFIVWQHEEVHGDSP